MTEKAFGSAGQSPKSAGGPPAKRSLFLGIVAAVALFWIIASMVHRGATDSAAGLIRWQPHERAAAAAQREGKPVLYDFTAEWCLPCHILDSEGWGDSRVADLVNESYLPTRVVDRAREEGNNPAAIAELQRRYSVEAFPTLVVVEAADERSRVCKAISGARD